MTNQSRFPWNLARKSAQPSSPTIFYNVWRHFWGKSRGNQREIRKSRTPKLLVADPSITPSMHYAHAHTPLPDTCILKHWYWNAYTIIVPISIYVIGMLYDSIYSLTIDPFLGIFVATVFILEVKLKRPVRQFQASLIKVSALLQVVVQFRYNI